MKFRGRADRVLTYHCVSYKQNFGGGKLAFQLAELVH